MTDKNKSCGCGENGDQCDNKSISDEIGQTKVSRRDFLKRSAVVASGAAALVAAMSPLRLLKNISSPEEFIQNHYKELSREDMEKILERITGQIKDRFGVVANVEDVKPMDGVEYAYALNLSRCNGSRKCVHACVAENNQSRSPEIQYISVIKMPNSTMDMEQGTRDYNPVEVPEDGFYYLPVQCQQCEKPPCVKVCPVEATWQEKDGITVIDYNWCIGCRYCEAACPYWARRFNFAEPDIPKERLNPNMSYLSNRPRPKGVVEKCHFCLHITRKGKLPACLEACPTGARVFGNVLDLDSEISYILRNKRVYILKEEAGTMPRFFYFFDK